MNDWKFWMFVARDTAPLICFFVSMTLIFIAPQPYSIVTAAIVAIVSTVFAVRAFYAFMRSKYECYVRAQEKVWNVLKDTK